MLPDESDGGEAKLIIHDCLTMTEAEVYTVPGGQLGGLMGILMIRRHKAKKAKWQARPPQMS